VGILDLFRGSEKDRIARRFIAALRAAGETRRMEYDRDCHHVVVFGEKGERIQTSYLGNLQRELQAASSGEQAAVLQRYARSHMESLESAPADYAAVRPRLRILLKDSGYPDHNRLFLASQFPDGNVNELVVEPVAGDVIACCVEESESSLRFITEANLQSWGVSAAQALADAKENVRTLPWELGAVGSAHFIFADDSFMAARLVSPDVPGTPPAQGEWVAIVPDRNTLFMASSVDMEGLAGLAQLARKQLEAGERVISGTPLVLREGRWHVFEPPEAVRVPFANVARQFDALRWADFKELLEKDLAAREEDIFVASLSVYEDTDLGAFWSMVVWSKDVDTYLPVADRVFFYDGKTEQNWVAPWSSVLRVMGPVLERQGGLPEHYRVRAFPTSGQLLEMGARLATNEGKG
jgi:hypothetical protein